MAEILRIRKLDWCDGEGKGRRGGILLCNDLIMTQLYSFILPSGTGLGLEASKAGLLGAGAAESGMTLCLATCKEMFSIRDIGNEVPYLGLRFPKTGVSGPGAGEQLRS